MKNRNSGMSTVKTIKAVELIVYDFDGVLTDNRVMVDETGRESVVVNRADGMAISIFKAAGLRQVILTTETNRVVDARARKLKVPVIRGGLTGKHAALLAYCGKRSINLKNVVYVGNDINDLEAMRAVGHSVCPADAAREVQAISRIRLNTPGGAGVARDLLRFLDLNPQAWRK